MLAWDGHTSAYNPSFACLTHRIAELLSQLPPELDIESLVMRTLAASRPKGARRGIGTRKQAQSQGDGSTGKAKLRRKSGSNI